MLDVLGVDDLALQQQLRESLEARSMGEDGGLSSVVLLLDDAAGLLVDELGRLIALGLGEAIAIALHVVVVEVRQALTHAVVGYHSIGDLGRMLEVVGRARRDAS